ncbi:MAG: AI-2E family transporter [Legionellales bacterium RIFCSPHIGHO2_12_FULL_37_14]|nr:MAG: AI-2E family transporter [Legionellales bacterium RIFCSPHIGHO2_12_FULL_37_14]
MDIDHKELSSALLTFGIVAFSVFIIHRFIPSIVWAAIIASATYPLYKKWKNIFGKYENFCAFSFSLLLSLLIILPISWLISLLFVETQVFFNYTQLLNSQGGDAPDFIQSIPIFGQELVRFWDENLGKPGNVKALIANINHSIVPYSYYLKQVGINIVHRSFQLGFTLLTLFFFYRDGEAIYEQVNSIGAYCLDERWFRYVDHLPVALRGTVNGTILVGLGVGLCMGACYTILDFPTPTLTGFITAFAAMIPFVTPLVFLVVALIFFVSGQVISALIVICWGTFVMFMADHFVKPALIGGAIRLPFLAVLFGILGGLEALGVLGLFVGPMVMVLFITLCQEFQAQPYSKNTTIADLS